MEAYGPLQLLEKDLWIRDGEWKGTLFGRRMTIVRFVSGELAIHNAFQLEEKDYAEIEGLGTVKFILVPNRFHSSEAHYFKSRFPSAQVIASPSAKKALKATRCPVDAWLPQGWNREEAKELSVYEVKGTRGLGEYLFLHHASKTLLVTDLVFHMMEAPRPLDRSFLRLNGIYKKFGPSRLMKLLFTSNEEMLLRSLLPLLQQDFERVIMNHGAVLERDGRKAMRASFEERFPGAEPLFAKELGK